MMKVSAFLLLKITDGCHCRAAGKKKRRVCLATGHLMSFIPTLLAAGAPLQHLK